MHTRARFLLTLSALLLLLTPFVLVVQQVKADSLAVSPPTFTLFGSPGDIVNEQLKVSNEGGFSDVTYQTDIEDFQANGDQGGISLIQDPNAPRTSFSLAKWVTLEPSRFTVPANQDKFIKVSIHIPQDAEPGGHYASVQVKLVGTPLAGGGASVQSRLNSLILLRVSGNLTEKLDVERFKTDNTYYKNGPVDFNLEIHNSGNVHDAPSGTIAISDSFGHKVAELPVKSSIALPGASRAIKTTWDAHNVIGRYTANLVASYGQDKQALTATTTFVVFPLYLIWIIIGIIIVIFLLITQRRFLKKILHRLTSE